MTREQFIKALRDCADWLESSPEVTTPACLTINVFPGSKDAIRQNAKASSWTKYYDTTFFALRKTFVPDTFHYDVNIERQEVCRRVVTGTKVIPAKPEQTVEEYEWVCDEASVIEGEP